MKMMLKLNFFKKIYKYKNILLKTNNTDKKTKNSYIT